MVVIADGAAKIRETKPKAVVKSKPEVVIQISPDSNEETKQKTSMKQRSSSSSRKKVHTMTSVLTARSKAASGITEKLNKLVPHIDALDVGDQLAVVDYIEDIYNFYKLSEVQHSDLKR